MAEQNLFPNTDGTQITGLTATRSLSGGTPSNIVDGDTGTNDLMGTWHNYWTVDLGAVKNICKYRIYPVDNTATIIIYASSTGAFTGEEYYLDYLSTGGSGASQRGITLGAWNDFYINPKIQARYIRIWTENNNVKLGEFEVYEDSTTAFGTLSSDDTDYDGAITTIEEFRRRSLTDNITTSNPPGSSQYFNVGKYFQVDLGSSKNISKIGTYVNNTCTYSVKVSTTGAFAGEEVVVVNNLARTVGQYNDTTNLPYNCRYIRIIASGSNTQLTEVTIYELQVTTIQKTILSNSYIKLMDIQKTIASGAKVILGRETKTIDSDTYIKVVDIQKTITSDTHIKIEGIQKTISSDAIISHSIRETIDSDAHIKGKTQEDITSDAHIKKLNIQQTINSDANIKIVGIQKTINSDALIKARIQKTINSDTQIRGFVDFVGRVRIKSTSVKDFYARLKIVQPTPILPTNLAGEDVGNGESVYLTWDDVSNYGYNIYMKVGLSWVKQNTDIVLNTLFTVGGLTSLTPYTFMVRGCNGAGTESANSNEVIVTPTFVKDKSASYKVYINGTHRTDAILKQVELVYGPSFSTATFELLKPVASAPITGDEVIVTIRNKRVFLGTIVIIDDILEETNQSINYTAVNRLWNLTHTTATRDFNTQEDQEAGIIYNTIGILSLSGLPITGAPTIWPGAVSIRDQSQLDAMTTIMGYCGNYKIHCDAFGNIQYYHFGTGPNRVFEVGKQILAQNIRTDITDKVDKVTIYRETSASITQQFIVDTSTLTPSGWRKGYYYIGSCTGYRVNSVTVEILTKPLPEITYAQGVEVLPGHCKKPGLISGISKWSDGSTDAKAPVASINYPPAAWTSANAEVEYVGRDLAYVWMPFNTQLSNPRIQTTKYNATFWDIVAGAPVERIERVEIDDNFQWESTLLRITYSLESTTTQWASAGSGSILRTTHDSNEDVDLSSRASVEFDKYSKPTIGGEILLLGDETIELMSRVNGYDIQRISHDFTEGFTTRVSLTNEPYYQGLNSFSRYVEKEKTKENIKSSKHSLKYQALTADRIKYLSGLTHEPKNKTVPEKPKGGGTYTG
jgi:hypothetical protein